MYIHIYIKRKKRKQNITEPQYMKMYTNEYHELFFLEKIFPH